MNCDRHFKTTSILLILIFSSILWQTSCNHQHDDAIIYNDTIVQQHEQLVDNIYNLTVLFYKSSSADVSASYHKVDLQIDTAITLVSNLEPYKGDTTFKSAALELFKYYDYSLEVQLRPVLEHLMTLMNDSLMDFKLVESRVYALKRNEKPYLDRFVEAQKTFAEQHGFRLN